MPEVWARCEPCDRWFFVPFDSGERMARALWPSCAAATSAFQVHLEGVTFPVELLDGAKGGR
jgi:hypothetical protein